MAKTIFIGMGTSVDNKLLETIEQILKLNLKLVGTTVPGPDKISMDQKQLDTILAGLNNVSNELDEKSRFIEWRTNRLNEIVEVLLKYTLMDFSIKLDISDRGDELDAIALGLNTLGEELDSHISRLKEKTEGLERSNKQLEQFVYVASHDLQEPLKTLSNYVNLFQEDYQDKLDANTAKYLDVINRATLRMRSLIKDLLDYARVGQEQNVVAVNCNLLMKEVLDDMAASIEESGAQIEVEALPIIKGHYSELKSLFQNLLSNAIKFKKKEGPLMIGIKSAENETEWKFSIADNGIGIEQQYQQRIFSIFQKLHSHKQYAGTGIGLAHCSKIVELHGGKIWVESEPGVGSTFYFTIAKTIN